ncbi:MAG: (d)CMP kinase [Erysipelotrichaceae bacterium]|nr:(d)CMP kinase [Erysipelotrichaceae bacterium]
MKMNIAIDGPSAAGKSTIAKILAKQLQYAHLDTGAMYRCVAYGAKLLGVDEHDEDALVKMIDALDIEFRGEGSVYIKGMDVSKEIRTNDISMSASKVSAFPKVRARLVEKQREIAKDKGYILDGRDIGTVVLPDAEIKIYMVASSVARAKRRYKEYLEKQIPAVYDEIYKDIEQRDYQDSHRAVSPLKKAEDAVEIDTSDMTIDEVVNRILSIIQSV